RSLRTAPYDESDRLLIVVGEQHRVGQDGDTRERYAALTSFMTRHFPGARPRYRWSTQDQFSLDGLPYMGRVGTPDSRLYVATGCAGWGLTNGTVAGLLIRDTILDSSNAWTTIFDPNRSSLSNAAVALVRENANVMKQLVGGRLRGRPADADEVDRGIGRVIDSREGKLAVYRDPAGSARAVSATCTHMGCLVEWNDAESTWDCPCHGSRYDVDGSVLAGPATLPLEPAELPVDAMA